MSWLPSWDKAVLNLVKIQAHPTFHFDNLIFQLFTLITWFCIQHSLSASEALSNLTALLYIHVLKSLTDFLFAHTVYLLNNINLKQHWMIIFTKGKLETSEAYMFAVFTGKRNALLALFSLCSRALPFWDCKHNSSFSNNSEPRYGVASFLPKPKSFFNHKVNVFSKNWNSGTHILPILCSPEFQWILLVTYKLKDW